MRTILVTGISGFIAKHCARELLEHGYAVRGTVRHRDKAGQVRTTLERHCDASRLDFVEADLLSDAGWEEAMQGVDAVLHLASPFPMAQPRDPDEVLRPAIDGTLRVLRACKGAGVPRLVLTSSTAAVVQGHQSTPRRRFTEKDWTNLASPVITAYTRSKTLAEQAAREFVRSEGQGLAFATINPGVVLGPVLDADVGASAEIVQLILRGKYPAVPRIWLPVVDVRDVARLHRLALEKPDLAGGRYLAVSEVVRFVEFGRVLRDRLGHAARRAPTRELPDFVVRAMAWIDPSVRTILPDLGFEYAVDSSLTRDTFGIDFIPFTESAPAMASSLREHGLA